MTNGELFFKTFPCLEQDEKYPNILWWIDEKGKRQILGDVYDSEFWNAEYKESVTKNDLGLGYISRQAVLELIADYDLSMGQVVKGIHALPSVTPQEPFINKPCVSGGVCEHDKQKVLDKIRAEIEQLRLHKAQFLTNDNKVCIDSQEVLNVIDKYKAESEA